ncbi:MAG: CopD family protein [Anaerolineae bacterium]|nr:CopD family protein [Anaerolineae bacterium]MCA9908157.1 CopD family protein [Anaerolineae bacterium]
MSPSLLALSYFIHLVATVVWIGGLVILTVLVIPEARRALAENAALLTLMTRLRKRFTPLSNLSLALLIATGMFQMAGDPNYQGVLQFNNQWSIAILLKHIAVIGMVAVGLILQLVTIPALERATFMLERGKGNPDDHERLRRQEVRLTWINLLLGIAVLGFTAWATAL